jgi:hypothetical protein
MNSYLQNAMGVYNEYRDALDDSSVEIYEYAPEYKEE